MAELLGIQTARTFNRDAVKSYRWEVVFTDPPAVVIPFILNMHFRIRATRLPGIENTPFVTHYGPYSMQHPGKRSYPRQHTVTFEEGHSTPVWPGIDLWSRYIFSELTAKGVTGGHGTHMWIRLLGQEAEGIEFVEAAHLYNVWPVRVSEPNLSYESPELLTFEVTFSYDFWSYEPWPF